MAKPFIKWAGGKTQILSEIQVFYPQSIDTYCEPFIGGGTVLFDILSSHKEIKNAYINDINPELTNVYQVIKSNSKELIDTLEQLKKEYNDSEDKNNYYYSKRDRFNSLALKDNEIEKASLFIFLNKTCFNGLYRVNKNGYFNVPHGKYKSPAIYSKENIEECSKLLQNVTILTGPYENIFEFVDNKTFVYLDPPYRPLTITSAFTAYSIEGFDDAAQKELKLFIDKLSERDCKWLLSNSDPKNVNTNDNFFDDLYMVYNIKRISAKRNINVKGCNRGAISELLVYN